MEKQKVIEKATKCIDALKMGHGHYRPGRFAEFADKIYEEWEDFYATVVMMAKESERKKGKWVRDGECDILRCDQCGAPSMNVQNFCYKCGAEMIGEEDE